MNIKQLCPVSPHFTLKFIDSSNGKTVNIDSFTDYKFHYQKEHKDTLLDQLKTLTIYVKKKVVSQPVTTDNTTENSDSSNNDSSTENTGQ